jgi:hypothetical protein
MDTRGQTGGSKPDASSRAVWRPRLGWVHATASLVMLASALPGCASYVVTKALGPDPQLYPPVVEAYEWAGGRGDELVVVYRVWGGHPRRHETRWTAIDLGTAGWAAGLAAPRVGALGDRPGPIPEWDSTEPVPVVPLFGPLEPDVANARDDHRPAGRAAVALYGRGGSAPELIVVTRDGAGALRFASWALRPTEDPGRAESAPGQLARGAAGVADVGTAPLQ